MIYHSALLGDTHPKLIQFAANIKVGALLCRWLRLQQHHLLSSLQPFRRRASKRMLPAATVSGSHLPPGT